MTARSPTSCDPGHADKEFPYLWYWRATPSRPVDRKGQRCRVVVRSRRMNSCLVEFEDGFRVVTSRNAIRKMHGG